MAEQGAGGDEIVAPGQADAPKLLVFRSDAAPAGFFARLRPMLVAAFDGDFVDDDWRHAIGGWHAAVVAADGSVLAHAAVVERRLVVAVAGAAADLVPRLTLRTGYVEAVASDPRVRGTGHGVAVMTATTELVRHHFEFGALATGSHDFYTRFGWERWAGPTYVSDEGAFVRTAADDAGVMVLRHGPSAGVDLAAPLACDWRPGALW